MTKHHYNSQKVINSSLGLIVGFEGTKIPRWIISALDNRDIEGVILFSKNFESVEQLRALTTTIQEHSSSSAIIAIDQEGGRVQRLREPFTIWPSMRMLGKHNDPELARRFGRAVASEMLAVGINVILSPVLCLDTQPGEHIADRSFGKNSNVISSLGRAVIEGIQSTGAVACAKHFPGYGAVHEDSHKTLPIIDVSPGKLEKHLAPFYAAIKANVGMIMVGHLLNRAVDPDLPSSISHKWINEILRGKMGYNGVVITDDLRMGAIKEKFTLGQTVQNAVSSSADLLLICHERNSYYFIRSQIKSVKAKTGNVSNTRLLDLRSHLRVNKESFSPNIIGCKNHKNLAMEILIGQTIFLPL